MEFPKDSKDTLDTRQLQQDQYKEPKDSKEVKDIHRLLQDQQSQGKVKHLFAFRQDMGRLHQDMEILVLVQAMGDMRLGVSSVQMLRRGQERGPRRAARRRGVRQL